MRTTRALLAELGGVSSAIVAAVVGVFVVVAAHLGFHGWVGSIPGETHSLFGSDKPAVTAPGLRARRVDARAAAATGAAKPTGPAGTGGVTLSSETSRPSGRGADRPTHTGGAAAPIVGHAHHARPPTTGGSAGPSVTTEVVGTVGGSVGPTKQKTGNGAGRTESGAPVARPVAPSVADSDRPSTTPVPTSRAPERAEARGAARPPRD